MEKLSFNPVINNDMEKNTKQLIQELSQDKTVLRVFQKNEISKECLERYPWKIQRWLNSFRPCQGCKGLSFCKQSRKGYFENLVYDGILQTVQEACRYEKDRQNARAHIRNYLVSDLSSHLETVSFKNISTKDETEEYLQVLAEAMDASAKGEGLYIYGTMGSGKTYLSACACNDHARSGQKVAFIHYPSFCQRMQSSMQDGEYKSEIARLSFAAFLVIDDIGAESVTEWNRDSILLPLLNERFEEGLPTWFTSNDDYESLLVHFTFSNRGKQEELKATRILERIQAMSRPVVLTGKDRRNILSNR
ncbi:MAG: ATP-binding protein [Solobacterium sp.]|nr:ATP-binding protein [Solobacterium sp.]